MEEVNQNLKSGSTTAFDLNWKERKESLYNHWTSHAPRNQIQLAFRSHWNLFSEFLSQKKGRDCLEIGCGRGSLSAYFAQHGYNCTLLDYSQSVLDVARKIFTTNGHKANFVQGDANHLPFPDESFDVVFSIGLLEHFENVEPLLKEQVRMLRKEGMLFCYIVPEKPTNIQKYFKWINQIILLWSKLAGWEKNTAVKSDIYRSDFGSERYLPFLKDPKIRIVSVSGVYPLPMISHSPSFPFSLLPDTWERFLTRIFSFFLRTRKLLLKKNPWLCSEEMGQAFLIVVEKGRE